MERGLFVLTGRWSVDASIDTDPIGSADFFATQSAVHGWRLGEWEQRSPRSVGVPEATDMAGWSRAFGIAESADSATARLACWYQVLAVHLAARYRRHLMLTSDVADAGVARWLGIAQRDVLDGVVRGATISAGSVVSAGPGPSAAEVADVVAACLVPLLELGF